MKKRVLKFGLVTLAIIAGAGAAVFGYTKYSSAQKEIATLKQATNKSEDQVKKDNERLIAQVKSLVDLPEGENPTIATVNDASKVKEQTFFSRSENGDRVLIYTQSKKAILYRPSTNKIIEIAPITISQSASTSGQVAGTTTTGKVTPTPTTQPVKVLLLNGTTVAGVTSKYETKIKQTLPSAEIIKDTAAKTDYQKSTLYVLNDKFKADADKLAKELGINIATESPYGEDLAGKGSIAIIFGTDKAE